MAEWSIAAVLKTVDLRGSGGSNPSLSATKNKKPASPVQQKKTPKKTNIFVFLGVLLCAARSAVFVFCEAPPLGITEHAVRR